MQIKAEALRNWILRILLTIEHCMEIRTDGGQNHLVRVDYFTGHYQCDITELLTKSK